MTNGIMRVKGLENFTKVLIILGACGNVESMVIFWGRIKSYTIAGYIRTRSFVVVFANLS